MLKLLVKLLFLLTIINTNFAAKTEIQYFGDLKYISDILKLVQAKYVDLESVEDKNKLIEGSIEGLLKKLDDPFTRYMPPETHSSMQEETSGEFGGLGILLGMKNDILTVIAPIEGTPAFRLDIRSQDQMLKINDTSTEGMGVEEAVKLLRGKPGTSVNITLKRENKEAFEVTIEREIIKVASVKAGLLSTGIGYARISSFSSATGSDLDQEIDKMNAISKLQGFILDLRGNPGGLLSAAVEVAQDFLGNGKTIVTIKGRDKEESAFTSQSEKIRDWPLIVLIDGGSASASEIVAGAIKDNKRGILVGTKTFGKGSVQTVIPLQNGAALALTTAYYYTPADIKIHKIGILPDIEVKFPHLNDTELKEYREEMEKFSLSGYDKTRKSQQDYLNSQDSKDKTTTVTEIESDSNNFIPVSKYDNQLTRGLDLLKAILIFQKSTK